MARSEDVVCIGKRLTYEWAPGYIFVGYLLSIVGSYVALVMVKYARQCMIGEQWSAYWQFISAAGIALGGTAIWAMHLIGMKALKLDTCEGHRVRVTYNAALTIGSLLAAIGFVAASMHLVMPKKINAHEKEALEEEGQKLSKFFNTAKKKKNTRNSKVQVALCFGFVIQVEKVDTFQYAFASAFLTIGAMVMHNMGMLAQYGPYTAVHNPYIVVASGVIAAVAAAAGLFIVIQLAAVENATLLFKLRFFAAITIASAVNTLHYVGMTGVHYVYRGTTKKAVTDGFGKNLFLEPTVVGIAAMMVNIMLLIGAQQYSAALVQEIKDASKKARAERVQSVVDELYERLKENEDGENAKYIPQLANVDPSKFGIAMCDVEGKLYVAGDVHFKASIQSVSKPLLYLLAMRERGRASVELKVGEEPSGKPFDQLAIDDQNRAFNPLINTGALTTASMLSGDAATRYTDFEKALKSCCHDPAKISMDDSVYKSEMETNQNNRHILAELVNHGIVDEGDADAALDAYTRACSCDVTALDIAVMAATIANGGDHPVNGKNVISRKHTTQLVTVMMSCGM